MDKQDCKKYKVEINDLPNELLTKIFACLSLKHDLDNVQQVSTRWYSVVDATIGREIAITSITTDEISISAMFYPPVPYAHMGCQGFDMISKLGVKTCYVDLTDCYECYQDKLEPEDSEAEDSENPPTPPTPPPPPCGPPTILKPFKYPHLLRQLYINASIRSDLFQNLLKDTLNLTMMQINTLALSQLTTEDLRNIHLPLLKALGIVKCMKPFGHFDDTEGLPNLQIFLEGNHFPRLIQLDLRFSIENFQDFRTIVAVLTFLGSQTYLKVLSVIMEFPIQVNVQRNYFEDLEDALTLARIQGRRCCQLKICEIQGIRLHASYPQLKIWKVFLQQQRSLQSLTLRLGHLSGSFLEEISVKNGESLEYIFLYKLNETVEMVEEGERRGGTVLDCTSFSGAKKLEILYALGCDAVINCKHLPKSLGTLFLNGVISGEDVEYILLTQPALQFISLKGACMKREGCGVTLDLLRQFIEKRRVNRLVLNGPSLNQNYPTEGLSNGDPDNPVMLIQFDNWDEDHIYLDWELNRDKYYIDKCY